MSELSHRSSTRLLKGLFEHRLVKHSILDFSKTVNRTFLLPLFHLTSNFKNLRPATLTPDYDVNIEAFSMRSTNNQTAARFPTHVLALSEGIFNMTIRQRNTSCGSQLRKRLSDPFHPLPFSQEWQSPCERFEPTHSSSDFQSVASLLGISSVIDSVLQDTKWSILTRVYAARVRYSTFHAALPRLAL